MRIRVLPFIVAAVVLVAGLSASTGGLVPSDEPASGGALIAAGTPVLKPSAKGLMTRAGLPPAEATYIDNGVVHVYWRDLERTDQNFDFPGNAWGEVAAAKARGLKVRLRFYAGIHAPDFVKAMHPLGKPFHLSEPNPDGDPSTNDAIDCSVTGGIAVYNEPFGGCVPYFWTTPVLDQYQQLMQEVARRYDQTQAGDHVLEVVASACSTVFAEPFYRAHRELRSNLRLWEAGLNETKDRACHTRAIEIHNATFLSTRTSLALNPWDIVDGSTDDGVTRVDNWLKAESFATWARSLMGEKLVIQNNGLGEGDGCPNSLGGTGGGPHFCFISSLSQPKGFQTETFEKLGEFTGCEQSKAGLYAAIENALAMKVSFVELPRISACGGLTGLDFARLNAADRTLEANAPPPIAAPGAPTDVVATAGAGQANVRWTPPASDGGSPVTSYTVTADAGAGLTSPAPITTSGSSTEVAFSRLTNGVSYTFTVHATNAIGDGAESLPSAAVTPVARPRPPTGVTAIPGNASAVVSWLPPVSNGGSAITHYVISAHPGGTRTIVPGSTTTTAAAGDLTNGTSYTFTVHASNAVGDSDESLPSAAVTPASRPLPPSGVTAVAGNSSAKVSWVPPTWNGGSAITHYVITTQPTATKTIVPGSATTTAAVGGLTNGTTYTFIVRAVNAVGPSAGSETPPIVPRRSKIRFA